MRSRWFHHAKLHVHGDGIEKKATWLELFYDLIFVAAFIQLGTALSSDVSLPGFFTFAGLFTSMWLVWTGFTYYNNRFTIDDFLHRTLVLIQMFAIGGMAVSGPQVVAGNPDTFAIAYAIALAMMALMWFRAGRHVPDAKDYANFWGGVFGVSGVVWLASTAVPSPWNFVAWGVAVLIILAMPMNSRSRALEERYPLDAEHLGERFGLLSLIVLGESFVKVLGHLTGGTEWDHLVKATVALLVIASLWWIYFDDVAGSKIKKEGFNRVVWLYAHLPLQIAITAAGVAVKKAVTFDLAAAASDHYRWLLSGTLALTLAAVALVDSVTERRQAELSDRLRVNVRVFSAVLLLLLAPAGSSMSAGTFLALVAAICAAQVVFDMMMAPFEEEAHASAPTTIGEIARRREAGEDVKRTRISAALDDTVRKGTPSELRRDMYFYFMDGGWGRFFVALLFLYIMINVFFAALYTLEPGAIGNARADSFSDAFFFSVQTISTIGFGSMSPETTYGHIVVTAEAAVGILGVAITTGLMFAKASRARAGVLFSNVAVVAERHGTPTLIFRVGNARGNDIVDATLSVTALIEEISPEGHHLRRLHDLELMRSNSPMFTLSWSVFHEIDDDSPLAGVDWNKPEEKVMGIIVALIGHDGTYGQTIYARHIYEPEAILCNHRFVDVISQLEDGRLMIDYSKFHDTYPLEEAGSVTSELQ